MTACGADRWSFPWSSRSEIGRWYPALVRTGFGRGASTRAPAKVAPRARLASASLALATVLLVGAPSSALAAPANVDRELRAAKAPVGELDQTGALGLPGGGAVYRFQQRVAGLKVLDGQAVVSDPPGGPPALVTDATEPRVQAPPDPRVDRRAAIGAAIAGAGVARLRAPTSATLEIDPRRDGKLVWRVDLPAARPLGDFEVLVDAASGDVVHTADLLRERTGHAKLYKPNPVVEHGGARDLGDHGDRNTPLLTSLRRPVSLPRIKPGQDCLRGQWANAKLGRRAHHVCHRGLNWNGVKRSSGAFEALMTYYQITRAQRYIQQLGFSDSNHPKNGIDDRRQVAVSDAFRSDNSFYSPFTERIKYGAGGVDDAEDADVILHEYAHAMQDSLSHAFLASNRPEVGALQEGSADYWAATMSARLPGTVEEDDVCIFDWDGTSYGDHFKAVPPLLSGRFCGRRADDPRTLAEVQNADPCDRDIHCVGQVWSSALWNLRERIGGRTMDRIYLVSQSYFDAHETFNQAAEHVIEADAALNAGAHHDQICAEMEAGRGLEVSGCS
jgi:hypothetical protein